MVPSSPPFLSSPLPSKLPSHPPNPRSQTTSSPRRFLPPLLALPISLKFSEPQICLHGRYSKLLASPPRSPAGQVWRGNGIPTDPSPSSPPRPARGSARAAAPSSSSPATNLLLAVRDRRSPTVLGCLQPRRRPERNRVVALALFDTAAGSGAAGNGGVFSFFTLVVRPTGADVTVGCVSRTAASPPSSSR